MLEPDFAKSHSRLGKLGWRTAGALGLGVFLALSLWWIGSWAGPPIVSHPAQQQIHNILGSLVSSEAEHVMGAYYPGIGATIAMDLIRGPNSVADQPSYRGTRDWAIYLMQTFGGQLTAVPPGEKIAMSIDFYDFPTAVYHQMVLIAQADQIQDPAQYQYWLDGQPFEQRVAELAGTSPSDPAPASPNGPVDSALLPGFSATGGVVDFADPALIETQWQPMAGTWQAEEGGYVQTDLGLYDLISVLRQPLPESYDFQATAQWQEGQMGAGLFFNAPDPALRNNAYMISYTGEGTYLQWGRYDAAGVFQFQGGAPVASGGDGHPHVIGVGVTPTGYTVRLDGADLAQVTDFTPQAQSYAGLLASTSRVRFDDVIVGMGEELPASGATIPLADNAGNGDPAAAPAPGGFVQDQWLPIAGQWTFTEGGYEQTQLGLYDLIVFNRTPVTSTGTISYSVGAQMQWIEGEMGGGLIFHGDDTLDRANTQMISFTDNGNYLQWGYFDGGGGFQYQDGTTVASAGDGQLHQLWVQVQGDSYAVSYDGAVLATGIPVAVADGSYAGLFASTSHVRFTDFQTITDPVPTPAGESAP